MMPVQHILSRIKHWIIISLSALFIAGCAGLPEVKQNEFILDTKRHVLCYNNAYNCYDLALIAAHFERDRLLRLYDLDPWDFSQLDTVSELVDLITTPSEGQHPQQVTKFIYRLPNNEKTKEAWLLLYEEFLNRGHSYGGSTL